MIVIIVRPDIDIIRRKKKVRTRIEIVCAVNLYVSYRLIGRHSIKRLKKRKIVFLSP